MPTFEQDKITLACSPEIYFFLCKNVAAPCASFPSSGKQAMDLSKWQKGDSMYAAIRRIMNGWWIAPVLWGLGKTGLVNQLRDRLWGRPHGMLYSHLIPKGEYNDRSRVTILAAFSFLAGLRECELLDIYNFTKEGSLRDLMGRSGVFDLSETNRFPEVVKWMPLGEEVFSKPIFDQAFPLFDRLMTEFGPYSEVDTFGRYLRGELEMAPLFTSAPLHLAPNVRVSDEARRVIDAGLQFYWGATALFGLSELGLAKSIASLPEEGVPFSELVSSARYSEKSRACILDTLRYLSGWGDDSLLRLEGETKEDPMVHVVTPIGSKVLPDPRIYLVSMTYWGMRTPTGMTQFLAGNDGDGVHPVERLRDLNAAGSEKINAVFFEQAAPIVDAVVPEHPEQQWTYLGVGEGSGLSFKKVREVVGERMAYVLSEFSSQLVTSLARRYEAENVDRRDPVKVILGDVRDPARIVADLKGSGFLASVTPEATVGMIHCIFQEAVDFVEQEGKKLDPLEALRVILDRWYERTETLIFSEIPRTEPRKLREIYTNLPCFLLFHEGSRQKLFTEVEWRNVLGRSQWRDSQVLINSPIHPGGPFVMVLLKRPLAPDKIPPGWGLVTLK